MAATLGPARFLQEVRVTANLQHPHILPLFDSGEADGFLYCVMPFVDGETLGSRLEREGEFEVAMEGEDPVIYTGGEALEMRTGSVMKARNPRGISHLKLAVFQVGQIHVPFVVAVADSLP